MLVGDVCFKPPITIKSHNFHVSDIKRAMSEITSYMKRTSFLPCFLLANYMAFGLSLAFLFVFHVMVPAISVFCIFCF